MSSRSRVLFLLVAALLTLAATPYAVRSTPDSPYVAYRTEVSIKPVIGTPGTYLARFEFRNPYTDQLVAAENLVARAGRPTDSETLAASPFVIRARVVISLEGSEATYSSELRQGVTIVAAQGATVRLPRSAS